MAPVVSDCCDEMGSSDAFGDEGDAMGAETSEEFTLELFPSWLFVVDRASAGALGKEDAMESEVLEGLGSELFPGWLISSGEVYGSEALEGLASEVLPGFGDEAILCV